MPRDIQRDDVATVNGGVAFSDPQSPCRCPLHLSSRGHTSRRVPRASRANARNSSFADSQPDASTRARGGRCRGSTCATPASRGSARRPAPPTQRERPARSSRIGPAPCHADRPCRARRSSPASGLGERDLGDSNHRIASHERGQFFFGHLFGAGGPLGEARSSAAPRCCPRRAPRRLRATCVPNSRRMPRGSMTARDR